MRTFTPKGVFFYNRVIGTLSKNKYPLLFVRDICSLNIILQMVGFIYVGLVDCKYQKMAFHPWIGFASVSWAFDNMLNPEVCSDQYDNWMSEHGGIYNTPIHTDSASICPMDFGGTLCSEMMATTPFIPSKSQTNPYMTHMYNMPIKIYQYIKIHTCRSTR